MMKQFVKTLPKRHPLSIEIRELFGAEGFTYLTDLLDLAQDIGYFEMSPLIVKRECQINAQKVSRIYEDLKRIFEESCKFLGIKFEESSKKFEESSKKVEKTSKKVQTLTTQNTDGSTRDQEEKREEEKREEKSPKSFSDDDMATAKFVFEKVKLIAPSSKTPNFENWANTVRLIRERDNHTDQEIREMMLWASSDGFWRKNILSVDTLREKWPRLEAAKNSQKQAISGATLGRSRIVPASERVGGVLKF